MNIHILVPPINLEIPYSEDAQEFRRLCDEAANRAACWAGDHVMEFAQRARGGTLLPPASRIH